MSTWIAWPPEDPAKKLPNHDGDPMDMYQQGSETESCKSCGFTVSFVSDKHQYEAWSDHTHDFISRLLQQQANIGDCPSHPKPNWIV